jgi:tripartite-type tricarboxylate transporter receptor subunit TctC
VPSKAIGANGIVKATIGADNIPVRCAGARVNPRTALIADGEGIVVVLADYTSRVGATAGKFADLGGRKRAEVESGVLVAQFSHLRIKSPTLTGNAMPHSRQKLSSLGCRLSLAAMVAATAVSAAHAQDAFPNKPIHIIVPYAAGGAVDIVTRLVGQKMAERLKQSVIVDNRPGAGTNIGMAAAAKSEPDGYTLLTASNSLAANGALYKNMGFDPGKDLIPIGRIGYAPLVVVVPQSSPFKTLPEMIAFGRANPDKLNYASAGNGSSGHLASELLKGEGKFSALHVPYKGGAPAITDMLGDRISFMAINPLEVFSHIKAGKMRALAVMDKRATALLPSVPTVGSLNLPGSEATVWWGLVGPKGISSEVVAKLNAALQQTLTDPAVEKKLADLGAVATPGSAADFGKFVSAETAKWTEVIKKADIHPD